MKFWIALACYNACVASSATLETDRSRAAEPVILQMRACLTNPSPATAIAKIARDSETSIAPKSPAAMADVYAVAVILLQMEAARDPYAISCALEMKTRGRPFLESVGLVERLWRLSDYPLPLETAFLLAAPNEAGSLAQVSEIDYLLRTWRLLNQERERTAPLSKTQPLERPWPTSGTTASAAGLTGFSSFSIITEGMSPEDVTDPVAREEFKRELAVYREDSELRNYRHGLGLKGARFTNQVINRIVAEYASKPLLLEQLQEVMDGYLPPDASTPVMNKVFEAMKPDVAAKTPRPVPGAKGERWIRPPAPRPEPGLPAIARPSKLRDSMGGRGSSGAVASEPSGKAAVGGGAGEVGGRSVWPWVGLGLAALAGGWVWLKIKG